LRRGGKSGMNPMISDKICRRCKLLTDIVAYGIRLSEFVRVPTMLMSLEMRWDLTVGFVNDSVTRNPVGFLSDGRFR
jgi:hypothetical protein